MFARTLLFFAFAAAVIASPAPAQDRDLRSITELARIASGRPTVARTPLAPTSLALFRTVDTWEAGGSHDTPNYLRALATIPGSVGPFATAFETLMFAGTVDPETKIAMGLEVARRLQSAYAAVHMRRLLVASERGKSLLAHLESGAAVRPEEELAVNYAGWLTADVHGVDDERFRQARGYYTDAQIVELTMTVSFANYFTRFAQAVNLPVEPWALDPLASRPRPRRERPLARVSLISDEQLTWARGLSVGRQLERTLGSEDPFGLVNSQRAMNLVPDIAAAWRAFTASTGIAAAVSQEIKLQVSFAVSMANGCRYCTLHQVQGLRRLGVSPGKLLEMQKGDSALTRRELTAVVFARKLTRTPAAITDGDYDTLRREFGEGGAVEVILQTCHFAFMNRFTDNLGLPSEDEAVRIYRDVYGSDWK